MTIDRPIRPLLSAMHSTLLSMLLIGPAIAADGDGPFENGGFLEIGTTVYAERSIRARLDGEGRRPTKTGAGLYIAGAWRRGSLFVEGRRGGLDGASVGVTLWHDDRRALELLGVHLPGTVEFEVPTGDPDVDPQASDDARSAALLDRGRIVVASGLRYREYRGDALLQVSLGAHWQHDNGLMLGVHAGHRWQLGNWSVEGIVGVRGLGADLVDYLYGVDEDEATTRFAAYRGRDTVFGEADLGISRALGRDWILGANLRARRFGDGITDSPLVAATSGLSAELGVGYVF